MTDLLKKPSDQTPQPNESEIQEKFNQAREESEQQSLLEKQDQLQNLENQQQNEKQEEDEGIQQNNENQETQENQLNNSQNEIQQTQIPQVEKQEENQKKNQEENQEENNQKIDENEKLQQSNEVTIEDESQPQAQQIPEKQMTSQEKLQQTTMQKARELLEKSEKLKNEAKVYIQQKYFAKALEIYTAALNTIHPNFFQNIPDQKIINDFRVLYNQLLNNCAFVHFQQKNYKQAIEFCRSVKLSDPKNVKAYYRAALCYKELDDLEKAFDEIKKARQIQNTSEVNQLYLEIRELYKSYVAKNKEKEKLLYSKMISNNNNIDSPNSNQNQNNLQMSKSVFEKFPKNNQKTWVTLLSSSILGFCIPTAMGANFDNLPEITGGFCLSGSIFGGIRFQGKVYQSIFTVIALSIVGMFYKFTYQKAIKNK